MMQIHFSLFLSEFGDTLISKSKSILLKIEETVNQLIGQRSYVGQRQMMQVVIEIRQAPKKFYLFNILDKKQSHLKCFPGAPYGKESTFNVGDMGSIPGSGRSTGEGNGYPVQYFYLEEPMDRGAQQGYNPWGHKEPGTIEKWEGKIDCFSITILFWFFHLLQLLPL